MYHKLNFFSISASLFCDFLFTLGVMNKNKYTYAKCTLNKSQMYHRTNIKVHCKSVNLRVFMFTLYFHGQKPNYMRNGFYNILTTNSFSKAIHLFLRFKTVVLRAFPVFLLPGVACNFTGNF